MPIYYFTELIGAAIGLSPAELGVARHLTEAESLLRRPAAAS
jgi:heterodisulfide reductase subunit B